MSFGLDKICMHRLTQEEYRERGGRGGGEGVGQEEGRCRIPLTKVSLHGCSSAASEQ